MIEARHPALSITRQCALIGISRSAWYGPGKGESPLNLALMKLIDAQFMETPFYGSRQMARYLRNQGYCVGRKRVRRLMARMGLRAVYQRRSVRNSVYRPPARFHSDRLQPWIGLKRSSNMMANWFTAVSHPLTVRAVFSWPRMAR